MGATLSHLPEAFDRNMLEPKEIATVLEVGLIADNGEYTCPLCGKVLNPNGWGPHKRSHLQAAGLVPPRAPNKKKTPAQKKAAPEKQKPPTVEEACLGLLYGFTNKKSVDMEMIQPIAEWISLTNSLIKEVKAK